MNRRQAIIAGGGLLFAGCQAKETPVVVLKGKAKCPCIDPDDAPKTPLERNHVQICAFHVEKSPKNCKADFFEKCQQLEVVHYCVPVNLGVFQCLLYDSADATGKLIGVEYVVTKEIYDSLPAEEKLLWHSHHYEIMNGLLTIHNAPPDCEEKLLNALVGSYGKTWHTWPDPKTKVPMGSPILMWSATADGQVRPELIKNKELRYGLDTKLVKKRRREIIK